MSFSDYLQNRKSAFENIQQTLQKETTSDTRSDDNIWKPSMGSDGTGYAVVRFLPGKDLNKTPWVRVYSHGFQGPTGKWYIENSLTTVGQQDPVSEHNSKLWNTGIEENKETARKQKRRTNYFANVLVVKDPANPSNEGKVLLYRFGQKIFDKIMSAMQPEFADETPINPFDLIEGANFRIKLKTVAGYWNYDSSDFEAASPLSEDEEKLEAVFNAQHDVHDLIAPHQFKSYEELQAKLHDVLGEGAEVSKPAPKPKAAPIPTAETTSDDDVDLSAVFKESDSKSASSDDDDLEDYFKSLAAD